MSCEVEINIPAKLTDKILIPQVPDEYICIMTGGIQNYKAIPTTVMQTIVDYFKSRYHFVQVGSKKDTLLNHVIDARNSDLLQSLNILHNSLFLITGTGGLTHLSNVANCKALVLQTGGEPRNLTDYSNHKFIKALDACDLCSKNLRDPQHQPCYNNYKCIRNLTAQQIIAAILENLSFLTSKDYLAPKKEWAIPHPANGIEDYLHQEKTLDNPGQYF